ncbi:hypothetical protein HAX54_040476 [Datura stramonium]|uniref:Uncharacterized protein n=1 Tax=Datura stramonium TaxID=4076 RepID=A0ABS8VQU5_DATST|nr:hypothetical protein [Datura stramonium]
MERNSKGGGSVMSRNRTVLVVRRFHYSIETDACGLTMDRLYIREESRRMTRASSIQRTEREIEPYLQDGSFLSTHTSRFRNNDREARNSGLDSLNLMAMVVAIDDRASLRKAWLNNGHSSDLLKLPMDVVYASLESS